MNNMLNATYKTRRDMETAIQEALGSECTREDAVKVYEWLRTEDEAIQWDDEVQGFVFCDGVDLLKTAEKVLA